MNLQPGLIIGEKYRIVRLLGQGGMGAVYEGENIRIHRKVAIKTLHASVAGKGDFVQRFEREAQAAGRIGSEHIVEVLDMGDLQDGSRFMVMEYMDGTTLGDRIVKQGRIPARAVVATMSQLLDGLGAAHAASIIHRDLKPANIFLLTAKAGRPDFVKILDFGVSKFNLLNADEMSMTSTGAVMGTPYYMSPEQAKGSRAIDTRSDLYSVGVILYEAITGQVPFNAQTFNELIFKIALESPPPAEQFVPNLDPAFGSLVRKSMARDPAERFQTAQEMKEALLAWARDFDARTEGLVPALGGTQLLPGTAPGAANPALAGATQLMPTGQHAVPGHGRMGGTEIANGPPPAMGRPGVAGTQLMSGAEAAPKKGSSTWLIVGVLLGATLVGAGAFIAYNQLSGGAAAATDSAASDPVRKRPPRDESLATPPADASATADASAATSSTAEPATPSSAEPIVLTSASAAAPASATNTGKPSAGLPTAATRPTGASTATTKPTATATAKPTSTGRDIRPDL